MRKFNNNDIVYVIVRSIDYNFNIVKGVIKDIDLSSKKEYKAFANYYLIDECISDVPFKDLYVDDSLIEYFPCNPSHNFFFERENNIYFSLEEAIRTIEEAIEPKISFFENNLSNIRNLRNNSNFKENK